MLLLTRDVEQLHNYKDFNDLALRKAGGSPTTLDAYLLLSCKFLNFATATATTSVSRLSALRSNSHHLPPVGPIERHNNSITTARAPNYCLILVTYPDLCDLLKSPRQVCVSLAPGHPKPLGASNNRLA